MVPKGNGTCGGRVARGGVWRVLCEWKAVATAPLLLPSSPDLSLHQHCCSESAKVAQSLPRCLGCCQGCNRTYNCASLGLLKLYAMRAHADDDQAYTRCGMWYAMPASTRAGMWFVYMQCSTRAGMDAAKLTVILLLARRGASYNKQKKKNDACMHTKKKNDACMRR